MTKPRATSLNKQLCFAVYSASHVFTRAYRPLLEPFDLTYPQYLVLLVLWDADGLTVKELGAQLLLDSGTLTPLLKRLEAAGHLRRVRDVGDERQVRILLTAQGAALKDKVGRISGELALCLGWPVGDVETLVAQLTDLRDRLQKQPAAA